MQVDITKIEAHRIVLGLNIRDFAKKIGMSHQWYYSLVDKNNNHSNLRIETVNKIASALGLKGKDLIK